MAILASRGWKCNEVLEFWLRGAESAVRYCNFSFKGLEMQWGIAIWASRGWKCNEVLQFWLPGTGNAVRYCNLGLWGRKVLRGIAVLATRAPKLPTVLHFPAVGPQSCPGTEKAISKKDFNMNCNQNAARSPAPWGYRQKWVLDTPP